MNSRQLEYFLAVAKNLNFTKAAEQMYVSQTAVTQQIKALEEQLGVSLFERTKKKVILTPAGKVFQKEAARVLARMDIAVERTRQASSGFMGTLDIGFSVGVGNTRLAEDIQRFNQEYPNIVMNFRNASPSELLKFLKAEDLDMVLMPIFDEAYFEGVNFQKVAGSTMIAVMPRTHILTQKQHITRKDIKDENLILACTPDSEIGEDRRIIESFWRLGYHPNVVAKIEDIETIFLMISVNMGVTILPAYLSIPMVSRGRLVAIPFGGADDRIDIVAAWMPGHKNPSLEKILPFLKERIAGYTEKEELF